MYLLLRPASVWICKKIYNLLSSGYQDLMGHLILTASPWSILTWITLVRVYNSKFCISDLMESIRSEAKDNGTRQFKKVGLPTMFFCCWYVEKATVKHTWMVNGEGGKLILLLSYAFLQGRQHNLGDKNAAPPPHHQFHLCILSCKI